MKKHLLYGALQLFLFASSLSGQDTRNGASSWYVVAQPAPILTCTYVFYNFVTAIAFVYRVADIALYYRYYPEIHIYDGNKVCIDLFTPGIFEITDYELVIAQAIDQLFFKEFAT